MKFATAVVVLLFCWVEVLSGNTPAEEATRTRSANPHATLHSRRLPHLELQPLVLREQQGIGESLAAPRGLKEEMSESTGFRLWDSLDSEGSEERSDSQDQQLYLQLPNMTHPIPVSKRQHTRAWDDFMSTCNVEYEAHYQRCRKDLEQRRHLASFVPRNHPFHDQDDEGPMGPKDTVTFMMKGLQDLMHFVRDHPSLANCSASFIRDRLRTIMYESLDEMDPRTSDEQQPPNSDPMEFSREQVMDDDHDDSRSAILMDEEQQAEMPSLQDAVLEHSDTILAATQNSEDLEGLNMLTDSLLLRVFAHLDGPKLCEIAAKSSRFGELARSEDLWRSLVLKVWPSMKEDDGIWRLLDQDWTPSIDRSWRRVYPVVSDMPSWPCTLMKSGRAMCSMILHNFAGIRIGEESISSTLIVERRFPIAQLPNFISLDSASILYFEPETPADQAGYEAFIEYLLSRDRVGLGVSCQRQFSPQLLDLKHNTSTSGQNRG